MFVDMPVCGDVVGVEVCGCVPGHVQPHPTRSAFNCKMTACSGDKPCGTSADLGAMIALAPAACTPDNRMEWSRGPTADSIPLPLVLPSQKGEVRSTDLALFLCSTISKRRAK